MVDILVISIDYIEFTEIGVDTWEAEANTRKPRKSLRRLSYGRRPERIGPT